MLFLLALGLGVLPVRAAGAGESRTDINPALIIHTAILAQPELSPADHDHVFTNDWRGRSYDARLEELITRYNSAFRVLHQAACQQVAADWGYDLAEGPALLLPHLARMKSMALVGRARLRWHLEQGRPAAARDEWLACLAMARQASRGGLLIGTLVQIALENILVAAVAEDWHRFDDATLRQLAEGLEAAPPRGRVLDSLGTERSGFRDWFLRRLEEARATAGSEEETLRRARALLSDLGSEEENGTNFVERTIQAAGGTSEGLIRGFRGLDPLYDEVAGLLAAPYAEFAVRAPKFREQVDHPANPIVGIFFSAFPRCRTKELAVEQRLAILRAAVSYRVSGDAGLRSVPDPLTGEPFAFRRFVFEGADRGFELRSKVQVREFPESMIFVEKDGPPFLLSGPDAGKAVR